MSDTKISALTAATTLGSADLVPIVQGGTNKSAAVSLLLSGSTYDATILAESSLTNYWKLNDAAGAGTAADSKGATAITPTGNVVFGASPLINDGETSASFGGTTSDHISIGTGILPASGAFSVDFIFKGIFAGNNYVMLNANGGNLNVLRYSSGNIGWSHSGSTDNDSTWNVQSGTTYHVGYTWDATTSKLYLNGQQVESNTNAPGYGGASYLGGNVSGSNFPYFGRIAKLAFYNAALTLAKIQAHALAAGL